MKQQNRTLDAQPENWDGGLKSTLLADSGTTWITQVKSELVCNMLATHNPARTTHSALLMATTHNTGRNSTGLTVL